MKSNGSNNEQRTKMTKNNTISRDNNTTIKSINLDNIQSNKLENIKSNSEMPNNNGGIDLDVYNDWYKTLHDNN